MGVKRISHQCRYLSNFELNLTYCQHCLQLYATIPFCGYEFHPKQTDQGFLLANVLDFHMI